MVRVSDHVDLGRGASLSYFVNQRKGGQFSRKIQNDALVEVVGRDAFPVGNFPLRREDVLRVDKFSTPGEILSGPFSPNFSDVIQDIYFGREGDRQAQSRLKGMEPPFTLSTLCHALIYPDARPMKVWEPLTVEGRNLRVLTAPLRYEIPFLLFHQNGKTRIRNKLVNDDGSAKNLNSFRVDRCLELLNFQMSQFQFFLPSVNELMALGKRHQDQPGFLVSHYGVEWTREAAKRGGRYAVTFIWNPSGGRDHWELSAILERPWVQSLDLGFRLVVFD